MSTIGYGYGSEWHLLRYLGYHRAYLNKQILGIVGADSIEWLDFGFSPANAPLRDDREFKGIEFVEDERVKQQWKSFWARKGNAQRWDAVAEIHVGSQHEWLLVEAKAHVGELKSKLKAVNLTSEQEIRRVMEKTRTAFGDPSTNGLEHWLGEYYQYANRLAVLHFLMQECKPPIPARLLFIYFCGENMAGADCPKDEAAWRPAIDALNTLLNINRQLEIAKRVHSLFLPVNPEGVGTRPLAGPRLAAGPEAEE